MAYAVQLSTLLASVGVTLDVSVIVTGIAIDSRTVKTGDLFCAYPGVKSDGRDYIEMAITQGAAAVLVEKNAQFSCVQQHERVWIIPLEQLAQNLSRLADVFYGAPSTQLTVIGITGTNGKTTVSQFIAQALHLMNVRCGVIGTLGVGLLEQLTPSLHTTPSAIDVQAYLAKFVVQQAKVVAMEVSSHGLEQGRAAAVRFHTAVFTNLSRDHLDYHGTMQAYGESKRQLFLCQELQRAVINQDDVFGCELALSLRQQLPTYTYSTQSEQADIFVRKAIFSEQGIYATVVTPWGEGELISGLLGRFNLSNVLAVISVLGAQGYELNQILSMVEKLTPVAGRMQRFGGEAQPLVVIDYAHTPDALQQVLITLREHCLGQLWCVFGCGGDRDIGKRALMMQIAQHEADQVVVTSDNPRSENPADIITDMLKGAVKPNDIVVKIERREAITYAITQAKVHDIVLIAGKGHEDYQEIKDQRLPFSDVHEAQQALSLRGAQR